MKIILALSLTLCLTPAFAADPKAGVSRTDKKSAAAPPPMDEATKKMIEAGTPGPEHERLNALVGGWTVKTKSWMKPGEAPMESTGSSNYGWVLDGRWLRHDFKGDMGGMPFTGLGHHGYDKVKKEYAATWMDSMSTGMATSRGQYDETSNTIRDSGSYADPVTGEKERWFRTEWKLPDGPKGETMSFSMWNKDAKGAEFKCMEMLYTRAK